MQIAYAVTQDLLKSRDELVKRGYLMQKNTREKMDEREDYIKLTNDTYLKWLRLI